MPALELNENVRASRTLDTQSSAMAVGAVAAVLFWMLASGFSMREAVGATVSVLAVAVWGYAAVRLLSGNLIQHQDKGFWLLGPCLVIGATTLFFLRLLTSRPLFLAVFLVFPAVLLLVNGARLTRKVRTNLVSWAAVESASRNFLLCSGLIGVILATGWSWSFPITVVALAAAWLTSRKAHSAVIIGGVVVTLVTAVRSTSSRPSSWWRFADGIPFDETILETISNGLVMWGPTVSPANDGLSGVSAVAYHHLLYLIVGLINWVASPVAYHALAVGTPIITAAAIVATLLLFVSHFSLARSGLFELPTLVLLGLIVCLQGLRGEGLGSPSSWLGIAAMFASFNIILRLMDRNISPAHIALLWLAVIAVALSKGTFVYALVVTVLGFAVFRWRQRRGFVTAVSSAAIFVTAFFSLASNRVDEFSIEFWPSLRMYSRFRLDFYTFLVFFDILIYPLLLGVASALVLLVVGTVGRQFMFALVLLMIAAIGSQLLITSTGPRSFELFYTPGIAASSLLILLAAVHVGNSSKLPLRLVIGITLLVLVLENFVPRLESETVTPVSIGVSISVTMMAVGWLIDRSGHQIFRGTKEQLVGVACILVVLLGIINYLRFDYPDLPEYGRPYPKTEYSDWYGTDDFVAVSDYIREQIGSEALFAYSLCNPATNSDCVFDIRPAVFSQRKFLALDSVFTESEVPTDVWRDIEVSRSIGTAPAPDIYTYLSANKVSHVLLNRERVSNEWILEFIKTGPEEMFRNSEYVILALNEDA